MSIEPGPVEQPGADGAETAPAPQYVTAEQFIAALNQQTQTLQAMQESLSALRAEASRGPAGPAPAAEPFISQDQYAQAVQTGDAGVIERYFDQKQRRYHVQNVEPLQRDGYEIVSNLQAEVRGAKLPHYDRYRKEIDESLRQMPPQVRAMPNAVKIAHDLVVGGHAEDLVREARESALRAPAVTPAPQGSANGRAVRTDAIPSAEELWGRDTARALGNTSEDDFARRLGYKDWGAYVGVYKEQVAAGEAR